MAILFKNNVSAQLAGSIASGDTSIIVSAGQGSRFPSPTGGDYFYATLVNPSNDLEVIRCTARTNDTLTVLRGLDGTTAKAFSAGDLVEMRPVSAVFSDFQASFVTETANNTFSGDNILSGNNTFSGDNILSGNNTFSGDNILSGNNTFSGDNIYSTTDWTISQVGNNLVFTNTPTSATITVPISSTTLSGVNITQTFTASQRGTVTVDNDGSFDLDVTNNFICTPTGAFTLTFTNITAGQSGNILLVNGSNYAITAAAATKVGTLTLATVSQTGTYWLSYYSPDGTNVYVVNSGSLS
jgi:hypothetical protein